MLALSTAAPLFTAAEGERIARDEYALAVDVEPLPGERDRNFHVRTADTREFVLKILDPNAPPGATDCQVAVLRHLAEQDSSLPVQRVLPTRDGRDLGSVERDGIAYPVCLMSYLPGQLLLGIRPSQTLLHELGRILARLDRALEGFYHGALAPRIAWDVRRLPELAVHLSCIGSAATRDRVARIAEAIDARLVALRGLRGQAIHGDCHGSNLLTDAAASRITGILDFGDMLHGPRILEPAVAMSELLTEGLAPLAAVSAVLSGYASETRLERAEIEALYDLIRARHAVTLLVHAWRAQHDPGGARILAGAVVHAARSLEELEAAGREALTRAWLEAAEIEAASGPVPAMASAAVALTVPETVPARVPARVPATIPTRVDLKRRHRLLGVGAELFYDEPLHLVRGSGVWLYDAEGREYLDVYNNVPHVGHTHPTVVAAIQRQVATLVTHTRYLHARILDYAERLIGTLPSALDACMFVNSGSEANDVAWRLARFATGHDGGIVIEHAYHGITEAVTALTPSGGRPRDPRVVTLAAPGAHLTPDAPMPQPAFEAAERDAEQALATLADRGLEPAACYIDSALTSSGILDPPPAWTAAWAGRVRDAGALIVADEVQYGLGRSGSHFWGFARRGLEPDIVTLGKPVGNGYPMGVVITSRALIEAFQARYGFFSTFGGNPVAAAAGLAVLEVLEREHLKENARATGEYLRAGLAALARRKPLLGAVRGVGLMLGLEVKAAGALDARAATKFIVNHMAARSRVLIGSEGPQGDVLKLRPPMPFRPEHADRLLAALDAAVEALAARG